MKIACPHCSQHLEVDETWSGRALNCPTCAGLVNVPAFAEARPAPTVLARHPKPVLRSVVVPLLVAAIVLFFGGWWASTAWRKSVASESSATAQVENDAPAQGMAAVTVEEMPPEAPVEEPVLADEPVAASATEVEELPGKIELIARVAAKRELWPAQLILTEEARFPAVFQGRTVGETKVPSGTKVELVAIEADQVEVRYRDGTRSLPHDSTNLAQLAATVVLKADQAPEVATRSAAAQSPSMGHPDVDPALLAAAQGIDGMIRTSLVKRRLQPPATVDDERFLRRAYVVGVGRIPTAAEAGEFLDDKNPHKRANLVARLVRSRGYTSQMSNWIFDRLRVVDYSKVAQIRFPLYRQWVRNAVEDNMPWNELVTTLLTTQGGGWDEKTAPVGYFTRDRGMPLDNLAITMRVFLGARMECAQCHNDPFGDTKQKDFFRLAAFTNGQEPMRQDLFRGIFDEMNALSQETTEHQAAWMFWRDVYGNSLAKGGTGRIALPHDYEYKDARPGDIEGARVPFGETTSMTGRRDRDDGREKLAAWMTTGTGERFPAVIANSMWRKVMGSGFYEPDDEYVEMSETHEPAISRHLADLMVKLGYNLRDFQEVLMLTTAFQAVPNPEPSAAVGGAEDFLGRRVQRLSAEQVWDSLITLISGDPDNQPPRAVDDRIFVEGRPVLEGVMTMAQLSREVLAIEDEEELRNYFAKFVEKVKAAQEEPADGNSAMAMMQRDPVGFVRGSHQRASELDSPVRPGHFVALFGQSNRELVDGSTREPNMAQVLSLMNGFVQREVIAKPEAQLNEDLAEADTPDEKIRQLYLSIFSREPDAEEATALQSEFESSPEAATANIASAMLMSAEFLYLQ